MHFRVVVSLICLRCFDTVGWCAGVVICLERGADLHMAQLMPLPLASKIQISFTFLVLAHPRSPGQRAIKRVFSTVASHMLEIKPTVKHGSEAVAGATHDHIYSSIC